jgi:hypothetical protein
MTNKTPFELRYELLCLAKDILTEKMYAERTQIENDWNTVRDSCEKHGMSVPAFPNLPTIDEDEVIRLACKMNVFVSDKNDNK